MLILLFEELSTTTEVVLSCLCFCAGLARKEDFPYVTYYCPHCHALNQSKQAEEHASRSNSPRSGSADGISNAPGSVSDGTLTSSSPVRTASEIEEVVEKATPENPVKEED